MSGYSQAVKQGKKPWLVNYYLAMFSKEQLEGQLREARQRIRLLEDVLDHYRER